MNSKLKKKIVIIAGSIIVLFAVGLYLINWAFFNIQSIDGQEYISDITSPNGKYTVTAYLNNGGATTSYAVLGVLKNNETNKEKNIYWQYKTEKANMEWINDNTIEINGRELNVEKDVYDYRKN